MNLYLYEEIMLLALRDDKGTLLTSYAELAVAGAVLAELLLAGKVTMTEDKNRYVELIDNVSMGDPIIDECMEILKQQNKPTPIQILIPEFAGIKDLKHKVARRLCERDILRAEEDKVLFIFTRKLYPEVNPEPEQNIIKRIHSAIFEEQSEIDPRTIVLISLAKSANLLVHNFEAKAIRAKQQRIEQIVNGELAGNATREVITAIETAILVTVILPSILTTTIVTAS